MRSYEKRRERETGSMEGVLGRKGIAMRFMVVVFLLAPLICRAADPDWKTENFAGPVPSEIAVSAKGHIEIVNIYETRKGHRSQRK